MTDDKATLDLDAIAARADAASPGEWYVNDENDGEGPAPHWVVANEAWVDGNYLPEGSATLHTDEWLTKADAEFIAHARTDIPALLAALAAERDRADRAEARLADAWDEGRKVTNNSGTWIENERRGTRTFVPTLNPYRPEATA